MKPVIHLSPISHPGGSPPAKKTFNLEIRLKHIRPNKNFFRSGQINQICSVHISTSLWGITKTFPGRDSVPLFEALEAYVGPVAGDKHFSRRMTAVQHTLWVLESLQRISDTNDLPSALSLYGPRGIDGLTRSAPHLLEINGIYNSLNPNEKKTLWLAALLHDIGKATGNRERHPIIGLAKLKASPQIMRSTLEMLSPTHTDKEQQTAQILIEASVGEHDLIGGLAITRDRNIFECAEAIKQATPDPDLRPKILDFVTLINFADIDSHSEMGIFTDQKVVAMINTYQRMKQLISSPETKKDYAWWGKQRLLAWAKGDTPGITESRIEELIEEVIPNRSEFIEFVGRFSLFDGVYNLATAIHDPEIALKFIGWVMKTAKKQDCDAITFDINFLTNPHYIKTLKSGQEFDNILTQTMIESKGSKVLRLSIDF